ncbi:MAG: hypothetical protein OXG35_28585 [Acidobacteria bacterium]|nr:hypothetical protein [Acidobacteriota bacterium]
MKIEFRRLDDTEQRAVSSANHGTVEILVNGRLGGYLIRDLPEDRGGRWFCSAWPHWPEGLGLQAAGLHDTVLSRDLEAAQRFVTARLALPPTTAAAAPSPGAPPRRTAGSPGSA